MSEYRATLSVADIASFEHIRESYYQRVEKAFASDDKDEGFSLFFQAHEAFAFLVGKTLGLFYDPKKKSYQQLSINALADWENKFESRQEVLYQESGRLFKLGAKGFRADSYHQQTLKLKEESQDNSVGLALLITLVAPLGLYLTLGAGGLTLGMLLVYSTSRYWQKALRQLFFTSKSASMQGVAYFLNMHFTWVLLFSASNVVLFFFSTARTFILFKPLITIFVLAALVGFIVPTAKLGIFKSHSWVVSGFGLFPFILNFFFALNLYFSTPLMQESHKFYFEFEYVGGTNRTRGKLDIKPIVYLENDLYEGYRHIRQFPDREIIRDKSVIHMNIDRGLFGLWVLKSWTFD